MSLPPNHPSDPSRTTLQGPDEDVSERLVREAAEQRAGQRRSARTEEPPPLPSEVPPGSPITDPEDEPVDPEPDTEEDEVPDGTIAQVREWVDDDPDRAARALKAEHAGANRRTLIRDLELTMAKG